MHRLHRIILILSCLFSVHKVSAQFTSQYNFNFKTYTTSQGLPDNVILKTLKDKNGFLWIATHNGISRFDGLYFKNYAHNPHDSKTLRSIWVTDLLLDAQNIIWASTEWGVCYYDEIEDQFKYINNKIDIQVIYKAPLCIGKDNIIWIAAEDGLKKINTVSKKYYSTSLIRIPDPQFMIHENGDNYLIGTRGKGLIRYNSSTNLYAYVFLSKMTSNSHFVDAINDNNATWIATDMGLLELHSNNSYHIYSDGIEKLEGKKITQVMCLQKFDMAFGNKQFVCGTYDKKLLLFDKVKKAFVYQWTSDGTNPDAFTSSVIYNLYADGKTLWLGTDRGLSQLSMDQQQHQSYILPQLLTKNNNAFVRKVVSDKAQNSNLVWL